MQPLPKMPVEEEPDVHVDQLSPDEDYDDDGDDEEEEIDDDGIEEEVKVLNWLGRSLQVKCAAMSISQSSQLKFRNRNPTWEANVIQLAYHLICQTVAARGGWEMYWLARDDG